MVLDYNDDRIGSIHPETKKQIGELIEWPEGSVDITDKKVILKFLKNQPARYEDLVRLGELEMEAAAEIFGCHCKLHCGMGVDFFHLAMKLEPNRPEAYVGLAALAADDTDWEGTILRPLADLRWKDRNEWSIDLVNKVIEEYKKEDAEWNEFFKEMGRQAREYMEELQEHKE